MSASPKERTIDYNVSDVSLLEKIRTLGEGILLAAALNYLFYESLPACIPLLPVPFLYARMREKKAAAEPVFQGCVDLPVRVGAGRVFSGKCSKRSAEGSGEDVSCAGRNLQGIPLHGKSASPQCSCGRTVPGSGKPQRSGGYPEFCLCAVGGETDRG